MLIPSGPYEPAQLPLYFYPCLFTLGFVQFLDRRPKNGTFFQPPHHVCGGLVMTTEIYRLNDNVAQAAVAEGLLQDMGLAKGEKRGRRAAKVTSDA